MKLLRPLLFLFLATTLPLAAQTNRYPVRGVLQAVAPDARTVTVHHESIPGYMMSMTMDFPVRDPNQIMHLIPGDTITFTLVVAGDTEWIDSVKPTGQHQDLTPPPVQPALPGQELNVGEALPDAEFMDESGHPFHLADFSGRAVAFTFFFTRCPLPDYCPRLNRNFAAARTMLRADTNGPANWQFLSVSFDATFDRPEILQSCAQLYRGADTNRWLFASASPRSLHTLAPRLDFHYWTENGTFSHNLRTVVLNRAGRISALFDGNDWTPAELAAALRRAALEPVK